jgi:hypothetical protein
MRDCEQAGEVRQDGSSGSSYRQSSRDKRRETKGSKDRRDKSSAGEWEGRQEDELVVGGTAGAKAWKEGKCSTDEVLRKGRSWICLPGDSSSSTPRMGIMSSIGVQTIDRFR